MKSSLCVFLACLWCITTLGQEKQADSTAINSALKFKPAALLLPAGFLTYGIIGVKNEQIKSWNRDIRNSLDPNRRSSNIDDVLVVAPAGAVYAMDLAGIKPKNNFVDRTMVLGTASTIVITAVFLTKNNVNARRPVGRSKASFPSGHASVAFMSATFLHEEYKHKSVWYGIAGYTVATFSGYMRLHNDKHYFSEVVAGAGIGILGTKIAYWLQPTLNKLIFQQKSERETTQQVFIAPTYNGTELTLSASCIF